MLFIFIRVEEFLENQEKKKHDLLKWREWKNDISSKLDDVQNTVDKIKSSDTSKNLQTVQDNLLLSEVCLDWLSWRLDY